LDTAIPKVVLFSLQPLRLESYLYHKEPATVEDLFCLCSSLAPLRLSALAAILGILMLGKVRVQCNMELAEPRIYGNPNEVSIQGLKAYPASRRYLTC